MESLADLTVKAMINAAKADGQIDEDELKRISGQFGKLDAHDRGALIAELRKPMNTDEIIRSVSSPQVAAQIYAASLLATGDDSSAERTYMADLASKLGLNSNVTRALHHAVGLGA